jgi:hypothetical protein
MTTTPLTIMNLKGSICRLETVMAGTVGDRDLAFARLTLEATGRGVVLHIDGSKAEELKGLSYRRKDNAGVNVSGLDAPRQICVHKATGAGMLSEVVDWFSLQLHPGSRAIAGSVAVVPSLLYNPSPPVPYCT